MAEQPSPRGGGKQWLGQPWWVWAAGGLALVGGYVYLRNKASAAGSSQAAAGTGTTAAGTSSPTGLSWEQFLLFLHDQQGQPATAGTSAGSGTPKPSPAKKPAPKPKPKQQQQLIWSGALHKYLTPHQWHLAHVAHQKHMAAQGRAA